MKFELQSLVLLLCLLFGRGAQAQAPSYTMTYETVTDTPANHFEDYWLLANAPLLTESGRTRLERGQVRLSLRAMSNPARYGLIDLAAATNVVTAAKLLCENRENGSLQLRCRMPGEPHGRRVRLTGSQCQGAPDLYTLVPEGCQRPYVMTVEGREVQLSRITRVVDQPSPPDEPEPAAEPQPVVAANPLSDSAVGGLQRELSAEREAAREHRTEARALSKRLDRAYIGLILLTICIAAAGFIAWRERGKAVTVRQYLHRMIENEQELRRLVAKATGTTEASGAFRLDPVVAHGVAHLAGVFVAARDALNKERKEKTHLAMENERLRRASEARTPSIVVDPREEQIARIVEEYERRALQHLAGVRAQQNVEREHLLDRIAALTAQRDDAQNRLRHHESEQQAVFHPPPEVSGAFGYGMVNLDTVSLGEKAPPERRGPSAVMTSGRPTHISLGGPSPQDPDHPTLRPPAPADKLLSQPAPTGSPPPSSPSPGDDHRPAEIGPWDPEPAPLNEAQEAAHPPLDHRDTSVRRPAIMPAGRVGIPLDDGGYISIEGEPNN